MRTRNLIVRLRSQLDAVLPELEYILVRLGLFAVFTIGLVTIVIHAVLGHH